MTRRRLRGWLLTLLVALLLAFTLWMLFRLMQQMAGYGVALGWKVRP